jgi:hypothetical protein
MSTMQRHKFSSYLNIYFSQSQIKNFVRLASCQYILYNRIPYLKLHTVLTFISAQKVAFNVHKSQVLTVFLHICLVLMARNSKFGYKSASGLYQHKKSVRRLKINFVRQTREPDSIECTILLDNLYFNRLRQ